MSVKGATVTRKWNVWACVWTQWYDDDHIISYGPGVRINRSPWPDSKSPHDINFSRPNEEFIFQWRKKTLLTLQSGKSSVIRAWKSNYIHRFLWAVNGYSPMPDLKVIQNGVKPFLNETVKKSCFHLDLWMLKYIWHFQCAADTRNRVKMK